MNYIKEGYIWALVVPKISHIVRLWLSGLGDIDINTQGGYILIILGPRSPKIYSHGEVVVVRVREQMKILRGYIFDYFGPS